MPPAEKSAIAAVGLFSGAGGATTAAAMADLTTRLAPPPEPAARVYTHPERLRVVTGIIVCILLAALDQSVVLPAIPQMAASLHGGAHLSWVVSAYLLTTTATTPIYGKLSDQLGRRAVLVPAIVFFLLASIGCALANSVLMLIVMRAVQGIGGGALLAVSQAAIADVIPPRERGRYQAWFAGVWAFASAAGPVAGGFVAQNLSWRWIFWFNLPVGMVALGLCIRGLAGLRPAGRRGRIDYFGALLMIVGVAAFLAAMSIGGIDFPWLSIQVLGTFLLGCAMVAALVVQQRLAREALLPTGLIAKPGYRATILIGFLNAAAMFCAIFLLPLLMQWRFHASPAASGVEIVPFLLTTTLGSFLAGGLNRRIGRPRPIMLTGTSLAAAGFLLMAATPQAGPVLLPIAISMVFGLGLGLVLPTSLVAAQSQASRRDVGAATGTLLLLRAMGGAFGATLAGAVLAAAGPHLQSGFRISFLAAAVLLAVAVAIALRMDNFTLGGVPEVGAAVQAGH